MDHEDVAWGKKDFEIFFISKDKLKIMFFLNDDKSKAAIFLTRDPSEKYYPD